MRFCQPDSRHPTGELQVTSVENEGTNPLPRQVRQYMEGVERSSPEPWQSGQIVVGPVEAGTYPLPMQAVHVKVFTAPVPPQCAQRVNGVAIVTTPLPPHTQHLEAQDMIPNGSFPEPPQNEQVTSAVSIVPPSHQPSCSL